MYISTNDLIDETATSYLVCVFDSHFWWQEYFALLFGVYVRYTLLNAYFSLSEYIDPFFQ